MQFWKWKNFFVVAIMAAIFAAGIFLVFKNNKIFFAKQTAAVTSKAEKLANPPQIIKAVYVTGYSAGSKKYLDYLSNLFENTEINAVVVDIKGSDGKTGLYNADSLINFLHQKNIYVIGRIAVFEDPVYAKAKPELAVYNKNETTDLSKPILWQDNNGLSWLDPASKNVWDYNVSLAKDAILHGFDEINFDYVRFPSDGQTGDAGYPAYDGKLPKAEVIKAFFQYLRSQLTGQKISVDLFGQTTINKDDMGIGQLLESTFENFDYVCPMVYPSHYINGFDGFANPADHPYEIIKYSLDSALIRLPLTKFRPWLQDFNMGAFYTADMVKQEVKATQDSLQNNYSGFMLWNASNIYNFTY